MVNRFNSVVNPFRTGYLGPTAEYTGCDVPLYTACDFTGRFTYLTRGIVYLPNKTAVLPRLDGFFYRQATLRYKIHNVWCHRAQRMWLLGAWVYTWYGWITVEDDTVTICQGVYTSVLANICHEKVATILISGYTLLLIMHSGKEIRTLGIF